MKKKAEEMSTYFAGEKLYGDDFSIEKIEKWFLDEKEAYAHLGAKEREYYNYVYHQLNIRCMFRYIPNRKFMYALGFGSAYGEEFGPIIQQIDQIIKIVNIYYLRKIKHIIIITLIYINIMIGDLMV